MIRDATLVFVPPGLASGILVSEWSKTFNVEGLGAIRTNDSKFVKRFAASCS